MIISTCHSNLHGLWVGLHSVMHVSVYDRLYSSVHNSVPYHVYDSVYGKTKP